VAFLHECGHLFVACWSGVKVEVFSVGVGPELFGSAEARHAWWLAVIPIGGYVRFVGDRKAASVADGGASELVDRDASRLSMSSRGMWPEASAARPGTTPDRAVRRTS
jgi:regulator of sigma E protease